MESFDEAKTVQEHFWFLNQSLSPIRPNHFYSVLFPFSDMCLSIINLGKL